MLYVLGLLSHFLFASLALARPSGLGGRLAERVEGRRSSSVTARNLGPSSHDPYTASTWAGGVIQGTNTGESYGLWSLVTGTIALPYLQLPPGGAMNTWYYTSFWVGMDGYNWSKAMLQAGIDIQVLDQADGLQQIITPWVQWWPNAAIDLDFVCWSGSTVQINVTATSPSSGVVYFSDPSIGTSTSYAFTGQSPEIGRQNAEWIVEDYVDGGGALTPLANFGTVAFTNILAVDNHGKSENGLNAVAVNIQQSGTTLTHTTLGAKKVTVQYV